jgi:hypothetical protein
MRRIAVAVQVADGDRLDLLTPQFLDRIRERRIAQRLVYATIRADTLLYAEAQVARDQRLRRRDAQVIAVVLEAFPHLQDVDVAFSGQQPDPRPPAFEQSIGRDRRPMNDALGPLEHRRELDAERLRKEPQPFHDTDGLVCRR